MKLTQEFIKAVEEKDVLLVRIMLKDSLIADPTFVEFDMMLGFALKIIPDLFVEHDNEVFRNAHDEWDIEYMDSQLVQAIRNFSKERIALLMEICRCLYKDRAEEIERERNILVKSQANSANKVGTGLTVGGVAIVVIGVAISKPLIIVTGAIVAVAGGVIILVDYMGND